MVEEINVLRKANESLGGVFEVRAFGLVPGLGSHVSWEERLDGLIGLAMLSIQAVKGCGIGDGFDLAGRPGSAAHDEIFYSDERGYFRETNRSGGIEGGMTTGEPVLVRCAMKPLPTLTKPLRSVDIATREPAQALRERTDSCTVPAAGVVGEAMLAIVLASACRDKFGGDHVDDVRAALDAYTRRIGWKSLSALVFIGFMGAGKTSAARAAAAALGARAVDSDHVLEQRLGSSIEDYFASHGERAFRAAEEEVVGELLDRPPSPVLSLGGGAITSERIRGRLAAPHGRAARRRRGDGVAAGGRAPAAGARPRALLGAAGRAGAAVRLARRRGAAPTPRARSCGARCRRCARWPARRRGRSCCGRPPPPASTRSTSATG